MARELTFVKETIDLYHYTIIFISLIGGSLILSIFYNIRQKFLRVIEEDESRLRVDKGLMFLGLSVLMWVILGIWGLLHIDNELIASLGINVFSILNNLFILLALSYFIYAPKFIYNQHNNIKIIILIGTVVAALTLLIHYFSNGTTLIENVNITAIPDFLLSGLVSYLLALSLYKTFLHRDLRWVAIISAVTIALMMISQIPEVYKSSMSSSGILLLKLVSKTSLIFIFLLLATSWVIELANTPRPKEMGLHILDWSLVKINIPSKNIYEAHVDFGAKTTQFKNLLKFAHRRKYMEGSAQCIEVGGRGEITSQTYLSRIIENINDILDLQDDDKLDRKDLFTFIGDGKYRLRFPAENITIEKNILEEGDYLSLK